VWLQACMHSVARAAAGRHILGGTCGCRRAYTRWHVWLQAYLPRVDAELRRELRPHRKPDGSRFDGSREAKRSSGSSSMRACGERAKPSHIYIDAIYIYIAI
jgi:hypothetical protein